MNTCFCGKLGFKTKRSFVAHQNKCSVSKVFLKNEEQELKKSITAVYSKGDSIYDVIQKLEHCDTLPDRIRNETDFTKYGFYSGPVWGKTKKIMIELNIYDEKLKRVQNNINVKNALLEKFGVENVGMLPEYGFNQINNREIHKKVKHNDEFEKYKKDVKLLTEKNKKYILQNKKYCFYTGIKFADEYCKPNPNDPMKRTVEHRVPIILCFYIGMSVEDAASAKNLCYTSRICNSLKSNTDEMSFLVIAEKLRERLINEGFEYNETGPEVYSVRHTN